LNFKTPTQILEILDPQRLPAHIAIIPDGNGRWAKKRLMNRIKGHEKGMETVREIVKACRNLGISTLTFYAFSTENWRRPKAEIAALMVLLKNFLISEKTEMLENNIRLHTIGQAQRLPNSVRHALEHCVEVTCQNNGMVLNLALNYGGRTEIVDMVKSISIKVANDRLDPNNITAKLVADHLYTSNMIDPDLLIRTSGEMRISNFLLWQIAYTEICITATLWPDFGKDEFLQILMDYQRRDRRFGTVRP
jgi:undecaprenyl diphosphate synthase